MNNGLSDDTIAHIRTLFRRHPDIEKAILYGSRAKGTHKTGSDIDLTLIGAALEPDTISQLQVELSNGPLPYQVDLSILSRLSSPELLEHINRVGVIFYERDAALAPSN